MTDCLAIAPSLVILAGALLLLVAGGGPARPSRGTTTSIVIGLLFSALCLLIILSVRSRPVPVFAGLLIRDPFSVFLEAVFILGGILSAAFLHFDRKVSDSDHLEALFLFLAVIIGGVLVVSSRNIIPAYIGFELLSVPSFVLVSLRRGDRRAPEAGIKYAVFGGASSASLLYGISIIYGLSGGLSYEALSRAAAVPSLSFILAGVFMLAGLSYKIAAVPFHFWAPDAYEGASPSIAGFVAVVPKAAGVGLLIILSRVVFPDVSWWYLVLALLSVLSMTYGNLAATAQESTQRILGYSSIAHAGYILVAVAAGGEAGAEAALFYLAVYLLMNIGAFGSLALIEGGEDLESIRGLVRKAPLTAVAFSVFLFSLAGLPPFGGFPAKLFVFLAGIEAREFVLVAFMAANSVLALYYYARIARRMILDSAPDGAAADVHAPSAFKPLLILLVGLVIATGLLFGPLSALARAASGLVP